MPRRLRLITLLVVAPLLAACAGGVDVQLTASRNAPPPERGPGTTDETQTTEDTGADVPDVPEDPPEGDLSYDEVISRSIEDIEVFWREQLPAVYGTEYTELEGGVVAATSDSTDLPGCGEPQTDYEVVAGNAFYCPLGDFIMYDDEGLFPDIYETYGPFVLSTILAHEWGHAVQFRTGVREASIVMEQQADCFAGAWTRWIDDGNSARGIEVTDDGLNDAMAGFIAFKDPPGLVSADEEGAHGSAFDRVSAFRDGYNGGVEQCSTYPENLPPVFEERFESQVDAANNGNLPYEDLLEPTTTSLDTFWQEVYTANNLEYAPLAGGLQIYGEGMGEAPTCSGDDLDADVTEAGIYYCVEDDYIAFDEAGLIEPVYDDIGDFAVSLLIGNAFADRVQNQLDVGLEGKERSLQADCMSGAWVGDLEARADAGLTEFQLSPGDLDEGVTAFLRFGDQRADELGTPFERVDRFRAGLVEGLGACGL